MLETMKILKDLEYTRTGGSKEELKAAKYIQGVLKNLKVNSVIEPFEVQDADVSEVTLEVTKPYKKKYVCKPYLCSGNAKDLKKEIVFVREPTQVKKYDVKDKIVLLQGRVGYWAYKDLIEAGCAGIIIGDGYLFVEDRDIDERELRQPLGKLGRLPIVQFHIKDLYEMIQKGAKEVKITNIQKIKKGESRNVVAKIKGETDRSIVFTAHYDSTKLSKGSWDNMSGSVGILKIAEYYATNKPHHNLIFVWCGSEERGLLGSKAYCKKHKKELDKIDLCINLDMIGSTLGKACACVTGEEKMVNYIDCFSLEKKYPIHVYQDVYSSDSTPFADKSVPAISFGSGNIATPIHCRFDTMYLMDEKTLNQDIDFILEFTKRMVDSKIVPISREMPDKIKEKLDIYLLRKRKEDK